MIRHMFVFGVLLPTVITILVFVGFLVCWFKFNIKERVLKSRFFIKHFSKDMQNSNNEAMHNSVIFSREGSAHDHHWDERDPHDPRDPGSRDKVQFGLKDNKRHLLGSDYMTEDNASVCSREDSQATLCRIPPRLPQPNTNYHHSSHLKNTTTNPGWRHMSGTEHLTPGPSLSKCQGDERTQQTFHFPTLDLNSLKSPSTQQHLKGTEVHSVNAVDADYGHFIPLDKVLEPNAAKMPNQKFIPAKCTTCPIGPDQTSYPLTSIWSDGPTTCTGYKTQQGMLGIDTGEFLYSSTVQDFSKTSVKFPFASEVQPALIPGI